MRYDSELSIALDCAEKAGALHLEFQDKLASFELKDDQSPVTIVDKKCEELIRDQILKAFPHDGFLGEETGIVQGESTRRWIVDPLDGTRPFIRGIPTHSVLIALECECIPVVGIIYLPALGIRCWAQRGNGAYLNGKQIHVSSASQLTNAMGSALGFLEKAEQPEGKQLFSCMRSCDYMYGFMDACSYVYLACGKLDFCVNLLDKAWDCAAASCIVTEAGGKFSDIHGVPSVHNGSIVLSNSILHESILEFFQSTKNGSIVQP